jgi:hypothetical protein
MGWFAGKKKAGGGGGGYGTPMSAGEHSEAPYGQFPTETLPVAVRSIKSNRSSANNYVAPRVEETGSGYYTETAETVGSAPVDTGKGSDEDMVVVEKQNHSDDESYLDVENPSTSSFTRVDTELEKGFEPNAKQSHLNSLFNGHLMKWKFDAEEGTAFLRIPACKCSW